MLQIMRQDLESIKQTEAILLSSMLNQTASNVLMDTSFLEIMNAVMNYANAFEMMVGRGEVLGRTNQGHCR